MEFIIGFFNSNFFIAFITFLAGSIAWYLYYKRNKDNKRDAANIILLEIQNAERVLKQVKERVITGTVPENLFLMPTESWNKYKYLFVRDFDRDEWDAVSEFYDKCKLYDESVRYNNSFFQKNEEQIRINLQRSLSHYAEIYTEKIFSAQNKDKQELEKEFLLITDGFQQRYMGRQGSFLYSPTKPVSDAKARVEDLSSSMSQTSIGTKLKKLAGVKE
jgi:hypothetical protein